MLLWTRNKDTVCNFLNFTGRWTTSILVSFVVSKIGCIQWDAQNINWFIIHPLLNHWNLIWWIYPWWLWLWITWQWRYAFFILSPIKQTLWELMIKADIVFCCFLCSFIQPLWDSSQVYEKVRLCNFFQFPCIDRKWQWDVTWTCTCYRVLKLSECTRPCLEHQGFER